MNMLKHPPIKSTTATILLTLSAMPLLASAETINPINNLGNKDTMSRFMTSISDDGLAAVVNNSPILKSDIADAVSQLKQLYKSSGQPTPSDAVLQQQALDELIMRELKLGLIKRAGVRPTDEAINNNLVKYAKAHGATSIADLQKKMDSKRPGSYATLRNSVIQELSIQALQRNQVGNRVNINQQDVDAFLESPEGKSLNQNEYQTIHIRVPFIDNSAQNQAKTQETAKFITNQLKLANDNSNENIVAILAKAKAKFDYPVDIQGGNMGYHQAQALPPSVSTTIVGLSINQVSETFTTDAGIEVIKLANKRVADEMMIPQWRTRHILIAVNQLQSDEMAKYQINDLYEQLRRGADFAKLAATYSDDPGSAGKGGDLDWVSEGNMVTEFENMMKKTPKGDFSTPFKTQFGWHILQIVDTRDYDASSDLRQSMAREVLYKRAAPQAQEDWLQELRSSAYIRIYE